MITSSESKEATYLQRPPCLSEECPPVCLQFAIQKRFESLDIRCIDLMDDAIMTYSLMLYTFCFVLYHHVLYNVVGCTLAAVFSYWNI
jgi:hypothetical protein